MREHFQNRPAKPSLLRSTRPGAVDRMKVHVQMKRRMHSSSDEKLRSAVWRVAAAGRGAGGRHEVSDWGKGKQEGADRTHHGEREKLGWTGHGGRAGSGVEGRAELERAGTISGAGRRVYDLGSDSRSARRVRRAVRTCDDEH